MLQLMARPLPRSATTMSLLFVAHLTVGGPVAGQTTPIAGPLAREYAALQAIAAGHLLGVADSLPQAHHPSPKALVQRVGGEASVAAIRGVGNEARSEDWYINQTKEIARRLQQVGIVVRTHTAVRQPYQRPRSMDGFLARTADGSTLAECTWRARDRTDCAWSADQSVGVLLHIGDPNNRGERFSVPVTVYVAPTDDTPSDRFTVVVDVVRSSDTWVVAGVRRLSVLF